MLAVTFAAERDANRQVDRTQRILRVALAGERSVVDIETALRGYVITLDRSFLGPYRTGVPTATRATRRLVELTAPDADDQAVARRLRAEVAAYIRDYARPLAGLAATSPDQARSTTNIEEGRRRVDAIRADFDRLTAGERRHLAARSAGADRAARRAVVVGVGGLLVLLVLVGAFGWYVARRIARPVRDISIAAGRVAAGDLDVRVPEGGPGDLDRLSRAFNAMAASLAEAQDALRRRADELEASGRRTAALLEPVFEQAPAGLAVFDEQMRFVRVNAALARMDGVPQEEHLGRTIGEVLPGMAGELGARLRDVIAERRTITDAEVEGRTRARPGEVRVWRASYFPVLADEGPAIGSGAIFVDITDHRRAERERRRLLVAERLAAAHTARLQEITSRLSRAVGAGDVAQVVVDQGVAALRAQAGVVVLLERGVVRAAARRPGRLRRARGARLARRAAVGHGAARGGGAGGPGRGGGRPARAARALPGPGARPRAAGAPLVDRGPDPRRRRGARRRHVRVRRVAAAARRRHAPAGAAPRAGRAGARPGRAVRAPAPHRLDAPTQPAARPPARDPRDRHRRGLPPGGGRQRGRRGLLRRRADVRRALRRRDRRRAGQGPGGGGAHRARAPHAARRDAARRRPRAPAADAQPRRPPRRHRPLLHGRARGDRARVAGTCGCASRAAATCRRSSPGATRRRPRSPAAGRCSASRRRSTWSARTSSSASATASSSTPTACSTRPRRPRR